MARRQRCRLIAIEGTDSIGKETQTSLLARRLQQEDVSVATFELPCPDRLTHPVIKHMLASGSARSWPLLFQSLQFVNKLIFQTFVLSRALKQFDCVILDRWDASLWTYGKSSGIREWILSLMLWFFRVPDLRIVLFGDMFPRPGRDSYESDAEFQTLVARNYRAWARATDAIMVHANRNIVDVNNDIFSHALGVLGE